MNGFPIRMDIKYWEAITAVAVVLLLTAFCQVMQLSLMIPILLLFGGIQLFFLKKANFRRFLHLGLLLTLLSFAAIYVGHDETSLFFLYLPVASIAMLTILLFNDIELAFIMALVSSVLVSLILKTDLTILLVFLTGSLTGIYTVRDARNRGTLLRAGVFIGFMNAVCLVLIHPEWNFVFTQAFMKNYLQPVFLNGLISAFIVAATLKIFESWFGAMTNFSLLELSDFNHPLLKRMILEAPGTYHHSLVVSNLSEAAADTIGANSLLTRVGSYYHDIGKMVKPEYFTENQMVGGNKHDKIEPSISRLVIVNHVKEGIELAKKYKLNSAIIDFIPQHHGTGLMYYFYQKALEEAQEESNVKEENYRYPGPKPQSRETAIVLLADSVEGATRSLDEPNPQRIEEVVRRIINNKFIDGQLDECNLTLKEIELIAVTFTRALSAMYHGRIKYPEKKNGSELRNRKSAEENFHSSAQDQEGPQVDS